MKTGKLPLSSARIAQLAATLILPLLFTVAMINWMPPKQGNSLVAGIIVAATCALLAGIVVLAVRRNSIEIAPEALVIRHSFYTFKLERNTVTGVQCTQAASMSELGVTVRTNGVSAFRYHSGWYWGGRGKQTFCAISGWPVYLFTFEGSAKCQRLALSATPEQAAAIQEWANSQKI